MTFFLIVSVSTLLAFGSKFLCLLWAFLFLLCSKFYVQRWLFFGGLESGAWLNSFRTILTSLCMHFIRFSRLGFRWTISTSRNCQTCRFPSAGLPLNARLFLFSSKLSLPSQTFIFAGLLSPKMRSVVYGISGALRIRKEEMQKSATLKTLPNLTLLNFSCICLKASLIPSSTLRNHCTLISSGYSAHLKKLSFLMMLIFRPNLMLFADTPAAILTQRICSTKKATQSSSWKWTPQLNRLITVKRGPKQTLVLREHCALLSLRKRGPEKQFQSPNQYLHQ